jgi:hypothetical protein
MARTKQKFRKNGKKAPRKQNRPRPCNYEIDWRMKKAMELYPNFPPNVGLTKIGRILGYVSMFSTILYYNNIIKCSHIINLFLVRGSDGRMIQELTIRWKRWKRRTLPHL